MKNLNLIKRLWTDSHEKQSPQRFARYAAILIMLLTLGAGQMWADEITSSTDGDMYLYFNMTSPYSWWNCGTNGSQNFTYFWGDGGNQWSAAAIQVDGNMYAIKVPVGTWKNLILVRNKDTSADWDNWNQSNDQSVSSSHNYLTSFHVDKQGDSYPDSQWDDYILESTGSLSASSESITTAETSTLTPSLTSNTTYNVIKSTSYSVTTNPGSAGSVTSGGVFSATAAGTYTVTATITYNAKGFTGITETVSPTISITVTAAATNSLTVSAGTGISAVTGSDADISAGDDIDITATVATGYTWDRWTLSGSGTLSTFTATTKNQTVTVGTAGNMTLTASATENKSTITVTANNTSAGSLKFGETSKTWGQTPSLGVSTSQAITATASSGYVFCNWVLSGAAASASDLTSATITLKADGSGNTGTATAMFYEDYYYRGNKNSWAGTSTDKLVPHTCGYYAYYKAATGAHNFKITPDASSYDYACNMFDNSYGDLTLTSVDDGFGGTNVRCAGDGGSGHFICMLYPNTAVNDLTTPIIFAIDGDDEGDLPNLAPETTYATTFYAGNHGAINAKGTAIAKNGNASVNIGATARTLTATPESGYSFDKWVTTGSVTVTDPYSASTTVSASAAGGTVTATYLANSGWDVIGDDFGGWGTSSSYDIDRPYRGISGVYYRIENITTTSRYFKFADGTDQYGQETGNDVTIANNTQYSIAAVSGYKTSFITNNNGSVWLVIDGNNKKFWAQTPATYYTVTVSNDGSGSKGTVKLKEKSYGGLETVKFASGETIHVEIDTVAHYSIASVSLGATAVSMSKSGTKYVGDAVMPASDATLTVTYTPWYQVKLAASPAAAADAPTAAKTTGGATVNHNDYVISGTSVTFTKQSANGGYTWDHWENNGSGSETGNTYVATISATTTVTAVYTENDYTVTVQSSDATYGGTVASSSVDGHKTTLVTLPKATPKPGYYFVNWTTTAGTLTNETSASACQINGLTSTATVTANFNPIWTIAGLGGDWDANKLTLYTTYTESTVNYAFLDIDTLKPNTDYQFKAVQRSTGDYVWWTAEVAEERNINYGNSNTRLDMVSGGTDNNFHMHTAGAGRYTFDINLDGAKHPIRVHYPTSYTVTFGSAHGTVTATVEDATAIESGQYAAENKDITFTESAATGYTFKGWYDAESGGTAISCMSKSDYVYDDIAGPISVYAQYDANEYAVTFDYSTNGGSKTSGDNSYDVTFDQTSMSVPTVKKDGYCFDGWYTAATSGKKVINPDGSFVANVTDWTNGSGQWKVADEADVYAVYTIPEIELTKSGKGLISSMPGYDTLIINQSFGCTPADDYNISYTVGYAVSHTQLAPQPTIKYCDAAVEGVRHDTIIMPVGDGANSYEVVAYLKTGTTRGSGDSVTVDTIRANVESSYSVRVRAQVDGIDIAEERVALLYPSFAAIHVTIWKEINGYQLDHIDLGVGVTQESVSEEDTYYWNAYYAANASTITAVYKPKTNTVYFFDPDDNRSMYAATRTKLYDYGTGGYWHTDGAKQKGAGSYNMTGDTVVATGMGSSVWMASIGGSTTSFAFTSDKHNNVEEFYSYTASNDSKLPAHVIYRTDYNATLPMFVPVAKDKDDCYIINKDGDDGWAQYYRGFWVKRSPDPDSTGYYLKVYDKVSGDPAPKLIQSVPLRLTQTGEDGTWELTATIDLEANKTYGFKFTKATGANSVVWYADTNEGTMTSAAHTGWDNFVTTAGKSNTGLTTTAAGDYTFHIYCVDYGTKDANAATATDVQGKFAVTVDYAAESGDYRVIYSDATQTEVISSPSIRPLANGQDTVSFFIRKKADPAVEDRVMKIQKFTTSPSAAWNDVSTVDLSGIAKDSVYVIYLEQDEDMTTIEEKGIDFYDGDYYIRTDCVDEHKWDYKKSLDNHRMIPTDYGMTAKQPDPFSHYYVHWLTGNSNVKFIVANKYAPCLSDTVITDDWVTDTGGNLGEKGANIRFMYNKGTNKAMRAYLYGSQENDDDYLKLTKTSGYMKNRSGGEISNISFTDMGNFTYKAEIAAHPGLRGKLTAEYLGRDQYFLGSSTTDEQLIGGTDGEFQNILLTYDFKTNRLICAWQPSGATITEDLDINADILIIRKAQGDAQQIRFSGSKKIDDVHYIYGVIEFEYNSMYHQMYRWDYRSYAQCMYYISFPFDVLVNDITGVGALGKDWRIQRYNGAKRAEKGWFADGEKTFWEDIHAGDTLKAYEGYSLLLNRSRFNGTAGDIWANKHAGDKVYLYFPSVSPMVGELSNQEVTVHVPAHECTKDQTFVNSRGMLVNHKVTDSHWNMVGTPMFADTTAFSIEAGPTIGSETLQYIYAWNYYGNTLGIKLALDDDWRFKTMYSYMVQYTGDIVFEGPAVNKVVAAKRNEPKKNYHLNLELTKDDQFIGRTYVELRENAVDTFLLNEDICMFRNGVNADLFTYAGTYEAGANVLPIADQTVQVGVAVKTAGTYVFSMPSVFDGEVILVDTYQQTRTNLALEDYEIALPTGEITDRFFLEIKINKVATAIDGTNGDGSLKDGNAHKFIENGMMYILQNGALYDAQGKRVK